jgi:NADH-quinone oxidoreductase subunit M
VNLGQPREEWRDKAFKDVTPLEAVAWAPLLVLILAVGIFPRIMLDVTSGAVEIVVRIIGG